MAFVFVAFLIYVKVGILVWLLVAC